MKEVFYVIQFRKVLALILGCLLAMTAALPALADMTNEEYAAAAKLYPFDTAKYAGKTVILHSNDVHGALDGYAYIAALKKLYAAQGAEVILADAGDFSQGSTYVSTYKGASAITMMNAAGYDVVTLGNHEFDFGYAQLMENLKEAQFQVICANVLLRDSGEPILPATAILEKGGLKIGFFGLETPETATKVNPGMIQEISITTFENLYTCAQAAIDSLAGCDLIVGLIHLGVDKESAANGYRSIDLLQHVHGVDILLDGHSHTVMTAGENGEAIQSTGTAFANVGVVIIDNETKKIEDSFLVPTQYLGKDAEVLAVATGIISEVNAKYDTVFAQTAVELEGEKAQVRARETNLGDLICDAMVWSVVKEGGMENAEPNQVVGITNGGGIRATVKAGDITMNHIKTVLPFGNTVAVVYVTGAELLEALEASTFSTPDPIGGYPQTSGIVWTLDTTQEYAQGDLYFDLAGKETSYYGPSEIRRVTIESVNGEPFDINATYAVVTNNFCAAGGDTYNVFGRAYAAGNTFDTGIPMDQAVIDYIEQVLEAEVTDEAYGQSRTSQTQILPEAEEAEEVPAA